MVGLECPEPSWRSILVTIYKVWVLREKTSKIIAKMPSKSDENRPWGHLMGSLFEFLEVFRGHGKSIVFWIRKNHTKICKNQTKCRPECVRVPDLGWPGGMRGAIREGGEG